MKKRFLYITITLLTNCYFFAQTFMNGGFEFNHATTDTINLSNTTFNLYMDSSIAFGFYGNIDIIKSSQYCGSAAEGNCYIGLTGSGSDAFSMKLSANLVNGSVYTISFYDRYCNPYPSTTLQSSTVDIGLSLVDSIFGDLIFRTTSLPVVNWTLRSFSFIAPNNGQYITAKLTNGTIHDTWGQLDGFTFGIGTFRSDEISINNFENIFSPNPTTGVFNIAINNLNSSELNISIIDIQGKEVYRELDKTTNATYNKQLNLTHLAKGMYYVKLSTDKETSVQKLIIQ